ncbi:MFS siderochrome iron transporter 1 [Ascochyta rabiei]|uniref:Transmembrane transport n=1 Tax=Didymella rabiei TaxID=5454 RepID=A0A163DPC7_DIDRA|nr:MFS siderochrome iron transporter 1 [Ascochyta rabiei]KZM23287.1 transmembrane transport [Ascochyta rabiei]UPX13989.1 MFS siderochrome iron transporter 1 [Ascochyta rabiei]
MRNPFRSGPHLEHPVGEHETKDINKAVEAGQAPVVDVKHPVDNSDGSSSIESFTAGAQDGVKKMEATTTVWDKKSLIAAYILMWVVTFVDAMQQGASFSLSAYVTSSFALHSLTAYTGVMSGIIGGVLKLPLAKILDIFGRPQGYAIMVAFLVVGLIMMAACNNVQTYAAAQIFYWIGYNGISYTIGIFVADTSHLKNRGFMFAYVSSPYIITVWITGPLATAFVNGPGWRWFYGAFAIITTVVNVPLLALFWVNYRKAVRAGTIVPTKSTRTFMESLKHYLIEFDAGGLFLLMGGLVFFLLPFSLWSYQDGLWNSALVISFFIVGGLMLIGFVLYEKFVAPKTFVPYEVLLDRTVLGACIVSGVFFISFYCWNAYFFSFLQVVSGLNITEATYVTNIYSIGSCFWSLFVGALIRWTGRFKWLAMYFGVPVTMLGTGLMIHFRQPDVDVGWVVMSQIFIAFAGGAIVITEQIAAMAATTHQYVAVVLAIEGMFSSVGGAIGGSVSAALWTGLFPANLARYLPAEAQADAATIYGDLTKQLSYPKGTPTRYAIEQAYGESQKYMAVASTAILVVAIGGVLMWRDINVKNFKQVKGRVL